jgi:hypothetical protein
MANDLESSLLELAEAEARKSELAHWLTSDLRSRPSTPSPRASTPSPSASAPAVPSAAVPSAAVSSAAVSSAAVPSVAAEPVASPDPVASPEPTLAGEEAWFAEGVQGVGSASELDPPTPSAAAEEVNAPSQGPDTLAPQVLAGTDLDEDDFAVLPKKPTLKGLKSIVGGVAASPWLLRARGDRRVQRGGAVAALLLLAGIAIVAVSSSRRAPLATTLAVQPAEPAAELPPPAEEVSLEVASDESLPVDTKAPPVQGRLRSRSEKASAEDEWDGIRGPSVGRFPDLPNRVLSRLAREVEEGTSKRHTELADEAETSTEGEGPPSWMLDSRK